MDVVIQTAAASVRVDDGRIRSFLTRLIDVCPAGDADSIGIRFVDEEGMRDANRSYRGIDRSTDVLSFPGEDMPAADGSHTLGDLMISVPTAQRQADERGHELERELQRLLIHGYLHLLGYDHDTDAGEMLDLERNLHERLLLEEPA